MQSNDEEKTMPTYEVGARIIYTDKTGTYPGEVTELWDLFSVMVIKLESGIKKVVFPQEIKPDDRTVDDNSNTKETGTDAV